MPDDTPTDTPTTTTRTPPTVGSKEWWLGGDGFKFLLQVFTLLFLLVALIVIVILFFWRGERPINFSEITAAQGLIAGVLLATIVVIEIVAVMTALFDGTTQLKDRVQLVRDVLAPLLAIFGTVTGFYFGTKAAAEKDGTKTEAPPNPGPGGNQVQKPK
jgi:hypothetical protein